MVPTISELRIGSTWFQVLTLTDQEGQVIHCKWEKEANRYQVAAALERLASHLRQH